MSINTFKLKAAMVEKYGSQANFAQRMELDEAYVSRIVNGRRELSGSDKVIWANMLCRTVGDLFGV